jgi:uncharacterized protein YecT (DUF1311 family)
MFFALAVASMCAEARCPESNQLEMNECASQSYKIADAELNKLYKKQIDRLQGEEAKERLRDSQRAWIVFRDKACLFENGPREESGSIWPQLNYMCLEYHTRKRIADIKKYLACHGAPCPE